MSIRLGNPDDATLGIAERVFDALAVVGDLTDSSRDGSGEPGMARLYAYASDAGAALDPDLEDVIARDGRLRANFELLLVRTALHRFPTVAAASAGPISEREAEGCRIRFQQSQAEPNQTYIIIELAAGQSEKPKALFLCGSHRAARKYALPEAHEGVIQMLVESDAEVLEGLRDIEAEVFLR
jgi:hypothetical protein